ncbi:uncharacterized protein LOC131644842 isoform X2 [Vicia villosa]|uniref:uncharacterized protein LOC131644842 isoform X2 n=1 Tax=Vicia villosa TaxID=3911 RepID=UPI00273C136D|nr:uncharacterized protein LOC131644842 isoform X2 [Vicia villosa]
MASVDDEGGSSSKKTVGKRGVTRLQKIHKAKSNGKRIEKAFVIGEEHRAFVYREAGKLHRAFRTKMARSYLRDGKGGFVKHRPAKYSYCIKQEDWDKFAAQRMSEKFQKVSKENRERALIPQHPYRKSRLGCARLEADMIEESEVDEISRSQVWKAARVNKNGVIDNENVQRVVDQCEKLTEALTEEERQDLGPTDILFEALNLPNYPGRVRSYGFGVLRQQTIPVEERQQPQQVLEKLQQSEKVAQKQQPEKAAERQLPEKIAESQQPSDKGSCNPGSFGNIPGGLFPVNIYLSSPGRCLVARGKLYNTKGNTVHDMTLPPGYVKVNIEVAIVPNASLPISVDGGDVSLVGHAIGTIVP